MKQKSVNVTTWVQFLGADGKRFRFVREKLTEDQPCACTRCPACVLACLQNRGGLLLHFLEDEVAKLYKFQFIVLLPIYVIPEDDRRSLIKRGFRISH